MKQITTVVEGSLNGKTHRLECTPTDVTSRVIRVVTIVDGKVYSVALRSVFYVRRLLAELVTKYGYKIV